MKSKNLFYFILLVFVSMEVAISVLSNLEKNDSIRIIHRSNIRPTSAEKNFDHENDRTNVFFANPLAVSRGEYSKF